MTGWIYSYGALVQNSLVGQFYVNVYDYGTATGSGFYFSAHSGKLQSVVGKIFTPIHYEMVNGVCTGVVMSGEGQWIPQGQPAVSCHFHLHVWKDTQGTHVQADAYSADLTTLLWGTGAVWPAVESTPIKAAGAILTPYKG